MLPSRLRKPLCPRGRGQKSQAERDALSAAERRRTAERDADYAKLQEQAKKQAKKQERVQNKIQRAKAHDIRKIELEDWQLNRWPIERVQQKTCTQCGEFGWNRFWCPNCDCLVCQNPEHIAADCPDLEDSRFANKHVAVGKQQKAGVKSSTDWRSCPWSSSSIFLSITAPGPKDPISTKILPFKGWPVRFPQDSKHESTLELY